MKSITSMCTAGSHVAGVGSHSFCKENHDFGAVPQRAHPCERAHFEILRRRIPMKSSTSMCTAGSYVVGVGFH